MLKVKREILDLINFYAQAHDVSRSSILAIGIQESGLDPWVIGDQGNSFGLMQLHVRGAGQGYTGAQLLWLPFNIELGCQYYARCVAATTTREDAISAYNQGIAGWQRDGRAVNVGYWTNVLAIRERLEAEGVGKTEQVACLTWV